MSRCSNALARALEELGETQVEFGRRAGIDNRNVNRYVRGKLEPGGHVLGLIARALPERQRAEVVTAWLRDMVPEVAGGLVSVLSNATARTADLGLGESLTRDLSPRLHDAIRYLVAQAQQHTAISDLMIDLARALRGDRA